MAKTEEEKAEKQTVINQIYQLKREVENLKDKLQVTEFDIHEAEKNRDILAKLNEQNIIDDNGKPV